MPYRITSAICFVIMAVILSSTRAECPTVFTDFTPPSWVKLQILSVRVMSPEEYSKKPPTDVIGLDVVVRVRLSCAEKSIQYYAYKDFNTITPAMHMVHIVDDAIIWLHSAHGPAKKSPGLKHFDLVGPGLWLSITPNSALEWEVPDSTMSAGECHALTIHIKHHTDTFSKEVMSPTYIIPGIKGT
jgi:hypothetical protein